MTKVAILVAPLALFASVLSAQDTTSARRDSAAKLAGVKITAERTEEVRGKPLQQLSLPVSASVTARKVEQTVNAIDPEDAVKYLPSVFLRKRNNGDTQAAMGTRVWGVSSTARSLVFADGVPLSALISNSNNTGSPRWGLVAPSEIERIDMMYGPFSAAYAGNSMGAVMEITTKLPDGLKGSIAQSQAMQKFSLYGTSNTYGTSQTSGDIGNRFGAFSVLASGNYQKSHSQPLAYVVGGAVPSGTTGGYPDQNKLGATANVFGATGLLATEMLNGKIKASWDVSSTSRLTYTLGIWRNDATSVVDSYLKRSGEATYGGLVGFATGYSTLEQRHSSHSLTYRTDTRGAWDFEVVAATYRFDRDQQRSPSAAVRDTIFGAGGAVASDTGFSTAGRVAVLDGTWWGSLDLKGAWRSGSGLPKHVATFGAHLDRYVLHNPTYNTGDWRTGGFATVATEGDGKTRTQALWAQDAWRVNDVLKLTVGGRYEWWRAYDGFNANGSTKINQPLVSASKFSPKATLAWTPTLDWSATASIGKAYRFATASELYQLVSTGTTFTSPDPNLKPDNVLASELRVVRTVGSGSIQAALFQDDVHDAIISQFLPLVANSSTLFSYVSNVDHVRARGAEFVASGTDLLVRGLDLSASTTYLDAKTLALSGRASATAPAGSAIGKQLPNIPRWRANAMGTYRYDDRVAFTIAGRYSGLLYTTLDNADVHPNTYQGFGEWFVMDAHVNLRFDRHWSASVGADNLLDRKYFLFHPFPQRTFVGSARFAF